MEIKDFIVKTSNVEAVNWFVKRFEDEIREIPESDKRFPLSLMLRVRCQFLRNSVRRKDIKQIINQTAGIVQLANDLGIAPTYKRRKRRGRPRTREETLALIRGVWEEKCRGKKLSNNQKAIIIQDELMERHGIILEPISITRWYLPAITRETATKNGEYFKQDKK